MKGDTEVILMIVFFCAGALLMALAKDISASPFLALVISPLATLAAAYFGARYAFVLHAQQKLREDTGTDVQSGNKAIFALIRIHNKFTAIRDQFIQEHRDNVLRNYSIMPIGATLGNDVTIDYDSLAFLLQSDDPNLLGRASLLEQEVFTTNGIINIRSELHLNVVQPIIEAAERAAGKVLTPEQVNDALGTRHARMLKLSTDFMIEGVDNVIAGTDALIRDLNQLLRNMFPGHAVIAMVKPQKPVAKPAAAAG